MPRIRSVKPDMRRSLTVCRWPYPVRWTFVGLPGYLDDFGRGIDDVRLVKAELYPLDDDMTARKLDKHLAQIAETGPLCRYEVDGRRYMHITSWTEHQKPAHPTASRIPPCPIHDKDTSHSGAAHEPVANDSRNVPEDFSASRAPAEQGTGNREQGAMEQGASNARGARLPNDWTPNPQLVDAMRAEGIPDDLARRELPRFRDYWTAQPGAKGRKADWPATWRNWLRRAADERAPTRPPGVGNASAKAQSWLDIDRPATPAIEGRHA